MADKPPESLDKAAGYREYFERTNQKLAEKLANYEPLDGQFDDVEDEGSPRTLLGEVGNVPQGKENRISQSKVPDENPKREEENEEWNEDWDEEDSEDDDDYDCYQAWDERSGPNSQAAQFAKKNFQTSEELFRKFSSKINVEKFEGVENLPSGAGNKILTTSKRAMSQGVKVKDKQDRATVEQVLDPRTRMIIYKLLSSGKIVSIDGCISTGKEANVYHATGPDNTALAIKVFKTSILTFKARDKYVSGEFRFRQGYCKKNPRKMVRLWAEKEFRNLIRIHADGNIKVPQPKILKSHVLVMDFIGENGWPCPLLKDVKFNELDLEDSELQDDITLTNENHQEEPVQHLLKDLYRQCLVILYRLFKHCKLVHADFSEFNLILKDWKDLYVIDVSQSVEHDHPRSFDFLRHDIKNVQEFFGKYILVGDYQEIFEFITSPNVDDANYESILDAILRNAKKLETFNVSDEVFRQTHIPRKMEEIVNYERDYEKLKKGEADLAYTKVMGMKPDMSGPETKVPLLNEKETKEEKVEVGTKKVTINEAAHAENSKEEGGSESNSDSESSSSEDEEGKGKGNDVGRPKNETAEEKKLRKKQVKEDKAEKRKTKVKKHVKKRKEKLAHANSKR